MNIEELEPTKKPAPKKLTTSELLMAKLRGEA